jgi:DNA-binding NarL/FixJ family response regulator
MIREGMRGIAYILKGCPPAALLEAMDTALAGRVLIDPEVMLNPRYLVDDLLERLAPEERPWVEEAAARLEQLTPREREVANRLAASHTTEGIARALHLTVKTVENYISQIYSKLGLDEMSDQQIELRKSLILAKACMVKDLQTRSAR